MTAKNYLITKYTNLRWGKYSSDIFFQLEKNKAKKLRYKILTVVLNLCSFPKLEDVEAYYFWVS